jgi:hypothetical protein
MKLKCRDANKIPKERLFCMDKKLYKITIVVEGQEAYRGAYKGGGDDRKKDDKEKDEFDDADDLEDDQSDKMKVNRSEESSNGQKGQSLGSGYMSHAGQVYEVCGWRQHGNMVEQQNEQGNISKVSE